MDSSTLAGEAAIRTDPDTPAQARLRILLVHNRYRYRGGEDSVVDAERELLHDHGHPVEALFWDNAQVEDSGSLSMAARTVWSRESATRLSETITAFRPDIIHVHNTFPMVSPSIYWMANRHGVPVVQTLHNFRLLCPQAMLLRDGRICEQCVGKVPWRGVVHRCYRDSAPASAVAAAMLVTHRTLGTYRHRIARYVALNDFCRRKFIEGGLPAERIAIKPNFVPAPAIREQPRDGLLFVGRLSAEKGVVALARAARLMPEASIRVIGTGPDRAALEGIPNVELLGALPAAEVMAQMGRSLALLLPSVWYENFPRTLVEAFAMGLPVIASRIGALAELIDDGRTGLLFDVGDAQDLARRGREALADPQRMRAIGRAAHAIYQADYTPQANYSRLIDIYEDARRA